jgi:hypothetical protein
MKIVDKKDTNKYKKRLDKAKKDCIILYEVILDDFKVSTEVTKVFTKVY